MCKCCLQQCSYKNLAWSCICKYWCRILALCILQESCKCCCKILASVSCKNLVRATSAARFLHHVSCKNLARASAAARFLNRVSCKNLALILQDSCTCEILARVFSCKYLAIIVHVSCTGDVHKSCKEDVHGSCTFLAYASDV